MSHERPVSDTNQATDASENSSSISTMRLFARETTRLVGIGAGTALGLMPLDYILHQAHTANNPASKVKPPAGASTSRRPHLFTLSAARVLTQTYVSSVPQATMKNLTIAQRNKLLGEEKSLEVPLEDNNPSQSKPSIPYTHIALVSAAIGGVDAFISNYQANQRTWNFYQLQNPAYQVPKPAKLDEKLNAHFAGFNLRFTRNFMVVGGLIMVPKLDEALNNHLPSTVSKFTATLVSGCFTGFGSNMLDIIYKNKVLQMDHATFNTPSARQVAKQIVKNGGAKALVAGYPTAIIHTCWAYVLVPQMEKVMQVVVPKMEKSVDNMARAYGRLFSGSKVKEAPVGQDNKNQVTGFVPKR